MPIDPQMQAQVQAITGGDRSADAAHTEPDRFLASALAAVGIDSPALMAAPVAIYTVDLSGRIASWNRAAEDLFGWTADEIIGEPIPFLPDDEVPESLVGLEILMRGREIKDVEYSPVRKSGRRLHVLTSATLLRDDDGEPIAVLVFATDTTAETESSIVLEAAQHKWRHLLMNLTESVTLLDADHRVKESTSQLIETLGHSFDEWVGADAFEFIHSDDRNDAHALWERIVAEPGIEQRTTLRALASDGRFELIEITAASLLDDPLIDGVVITTRNVQAQREAENLLAGEAQILELVARDAPLTDTLPAIAKLVEDHTEAATAILLLSSDARTLEVGAAGSVPSEVLDLARRSVINPDPHADTVDLRRPSTIEDFATDPRTQDFSAQLAQLGVQSGCAVPIIENRTSELLGVLAGYFVDARGPTDHEREVANVASHLASIAIERDRWQQALHHQARHHQLTGLPNRALILEHLDHAIARAADAGTTVAVMFIDLDRFKVVNDSLGHAAGDHLLARFGGRLANLVRPGDFVGHFGADEFIVILEDIAGIDDVRFVANRLGVTLNEPFALDEAEIFLSTSIGVALSPGGVESGESLVQHADAAMFRAKELGRDRLEIFDEQMRIRAAEQLRMDRDLRLAVERDELEVHFQPKVDLASGRILGAEALLRWHHPELGLVVADDFVGVAEDTGIIVRIGRWALEEAVVRARRWIERVPSADPFLLAVNLSARQISAPGLVDDIERILAQHHWPADQLVLELTESVLIDDRDAILDVLTDLKQVGVKLAIDDFGTGFSSLNYLHRFPVDIVKIDQSFVSHLTADGGGSPVVTAVMHMTHALGLVAAAEGVEQPEQLEGLRQLECDYAQGFLFSSAVPADDFEELLRQDTRW